MIHEVQPGVVLVGTAHVSKRSVEDVEKTIRERRPDRVLIELDQARMEALRDPDRWKNTDIVEILRQKKQHLFMLQLYLASMQARFGRETGSAPGAEMIRAMEVAEEVGAEVVLIDRNVQITLRRGFGSMGFWGRMRLFWKVWLEVLTPSEDEEVDVDELLESDMISTMTEEFAQYAPSIKTALIDERDEYMASHVAQHAATGSLVAVVGAGHLDGMKQHLQDGTDPARRDVLDQMPEKRFTLGLALAYEIPLLVILMFVWLGVQGRYQDIIDNGIYWVVANGGLAALGALLARGHILSAVVAFLAAPLTSLNPLVAAGWFAGLTEAKMHKPTVGDFEAIQYIETMKDFWRNDVVRILLVTALANLGSVAGTWIGLAELVQSVAEGT